MTTRSDFYVYVLFDACGVPRYVGKGRGDRWADHEKKLDPRNWMKNKFIERTLEALGEIPKLKVRANLAEVEAFETEAALIGAIGRVPRGPLTNMSNGGEGSAGHRWSPEQKKRQSERQVKRAAKLSPEERRASIQVALDALTPEDFQRAAERLNANYTPEQRKIAARKREANMTPQQKSDRAKKAIASQSKEQLSETGRRRNLFITPETRSIIGRKRCAHQTREQLQELGRRTVARFTTEQLRAAGRKGNASFTAEQRTNMARKRVATMTVEELSASALKGVETRRRLGKGNCKFKGGVWVTDGKQRKRLRPGEPVPEGYAVGFNLDVE